MALSYTTLRAETWWNREVEPPALDWLADNLCTHFGRPRTAAGIKGDNRHLNGSHRSQEWLKNSRYCTNRTYTVQSGLSAEQARWCVGLDFNPGSTDLMLTICKRLDRAVRAGQIEEVTEWYGNTDGDSRVDGYNNIRDAVATSDSSHLWHLHVSISRRHANDMGVMRRILAILTGAGPVAESTTPSPSEDDDMELLNIDLPSGFGFNETGQRIPGGPLVFRRLPDLGSPGNTIPWGTGFLTLTYDAFGADGPLTVRYRVAVKVGGVWTVRIVDVPHGVAAVAWSPEGSQLPVGCAAVSIGRVRMTADEVPGDVVAGAAIEIGRRA